MLWRKQSVLMSPWENSHNLESSPPLEMFWEDKQYYLLVFLLHVLPYDKTSHSLLYLPINISAVSLSNTVSYHILCICFYLLSLPCPYFFLFIIFIKEDKLRFKEGNVIVSSIIQLMKYLSCNCFEWCTICCRLIKIFHHGWRRRQETRCVLLAVQAVDLEGRISGL